MRYSTHFTLLLIQPMTVLRSDRRNAIIRFRIRPDNIEPISRQHILSIPLLPLSHHRLLSPSPPLHLQINQEKKTHASSGYSGASSPPSASTIPVKLSCSQQINTFPSPPYFFTSFLTHFASSRVHEVSTESPRSLASGCTVRRGAGA